MGDMFVALEFAEGGSLDTHLAGYGSKVSLAGDEKLSILRDVASGLANVHAARLVHRDVAARNVVLTAEKQGAYVGI